MDADDLKDLEIMTPGAVIIMEPGMPTNMLPDDEQQLQELVASGMFCFMSLPQIITEARVPMDVKEAGRLNLEVINANGFEPPRWTTKTLREQAEEVVDQLLAADDACITEDGVELGAREKSVRVIEAALREHDTIVQKLILVYTEVSEGEHAILGDGADPLAEELADIAIRVTGMLWGIWGDGWSARYPDPNARDFDPRVRVNPFQPIEVLLRPIRDYMTHAVEAWRKDDRVDVRISLELALKETMVVARACGIDLVAEMERKREKNATRPERHGNKRSDG
jgi:hypothetical protein